jgi:hypothetical protein
MANLTAARSTLRRLSFVDSEHSFLCTVGAVTFKGGMVALAATGLVVRGGTAGSITLGRSLSTFAAATATDRCRFEYGIFKYVNGVTAVTAAMKGNLCYVDDDQTVSSDETKPVAGIVYDVDSDGVWVFFGPNAPRLGAAT